MRFEFEVFVVVIEMKMFIPITQSIFFNFVLEKEATRQEAGMLINDNVMKLKNRRGIIEDNFSFNF